MATSETQTEEEPQTVAGFHDDDDWGWSSWEWWSRCAVVLTGLAGATWLLIFANIGITSVVAHAFVIPILGAISLPIVLWGLVRTAFTPPILKRSRLAGFGLLLVVGFTGNVPMVPAPAVPQEDGEPAREYRLPFSGEWYTLAGGQSVARNYHATTSAWRWGYDFTVLTDAGDRHRWDGESLEDYPCYGKDVLAPVRGEIVRARGGLEDASPGEFDETSVLGNRVVLKVVDDHYIFIAQLKQGSLNVGRGDQVAPGDKLGECGNSGRAVLPHVHIHMQDRLEFPIARGRPLYLEFLDEDGGRVPHGMPEGEGEGGTPDGETVEAIVAGD